MKSKLTFRLFIYDLDVNEDGGYHVNGVRPGPLLHIRCKPKTLNPNSANEPIDPSDYQLNRLVGGRGLKWDGDPEYTLYAMDRKGNPACELRREFQ